MNKRKKYFAWPLLCLVASSMLLIQCQKDSDASDGPRPGTPAQGTLVISNRDKVVAFDGATGKMKWEYGDYSTFQLEWGGTVTPNAYYIVSQKLGLIAINLNDGKLKWTFKSAVTDSYPVVVKNVLYFTDGANVYALDANTGAQKWSYKLDRSSAHNLTVANDQVFVGTLAPGSKAVTVALDASKGDKIREYAGSNANSSPKVANGLLYIDDFQFLRAYDIATGTVKWESADKIQYSAPISISEGLVFFNAFNKPVLVAYDGATGVKKWEVTSADPDLRLYYPSTEKGILVVPALSKSTLTEKGILTVLNATTGQLIWDKEYNSMSALNKPLMAKSMVFMNSNFFPLTAYDALTGNVLWSNPDFQDEGWISFVSIDGTVYNTSISGQPSRL